MNTKFISFLKNNDNFIEIIDKCKNNQVHLSRDLSNFGTFTEDKTINLEIWNIIPNKDIINFEKYYDKCIDNKQIKTIQISEKKKIIKRDIIKNDSFKDLIEFSNNYGIFIQCLFLNNRNENKLLYSVISSIYPEFLGFNIDYKYKLINDLCNKLSYNLDDLYLYNKFNYKSIIPKTKFQNLLVQPEQHYQIQTKWIQNYLSDYFNINIIIFVNYLIFIPYNFEPNRLCMLTYYYKDNFVTITNDFQKSLFPYDFADNIIKLFYEKTNLKPINKLDPISKYKILTLQEIAKAINIDIMSDNKKKSKIQLYNEIINIMPK